jgi:thiosulfate/3-mercaptopyruvate sulfurtransferase
MPVSDTLISPAELALLSAKPDTVVVDASWYLPADRRDTQAEFFAARIPGARFFDIEAIADLDHACPHMLPSEQLFADCVQALGIGGNSRVVVYDSKGLFSAARAWWMFRVFGHDSVHILEGGLPAWTAAGYDTEQGAPGVATPGSGFIAVRQPAWLADVEGVLAALSSSNYAVLDARSASRFAGEEVEPRSGVRPGHIPGSKNLHYAQILTDEPATLKPVQELEQLFDGVGAGHDTRVVTTCGSGISACLLALALHELGRSPVAVYDGSWAEWGSRADCLVERG